MAKDGRKDKSPYVKKRQKNPHALPANATEAMRAVALCRRLYSGQQGIGIWDALGLPSPLTRSSVPMLLNRLPQSSREWELLYAAIGRKLALKEPEFSHGTGAKHGSKHKDRGTKADMTQASKDKAIQRAKKELADRTIFLGGEELVLEPGVDVDLVKSALASIQRQKR
jgi:hypothetical protein